MGKNSQVHRLAIVQVPRKPRRGSYRDSDNLHLPAHCSGNVADTCERSSGDGIYSGKRRLWTQGGRFQDIKRLCILEKGPLSSPPKADGKGSLVAFFSHQCLQNEYSISQLRLLLYLLTFSELHEVQGARMLGQQWTVHLHSLVHPSFDQRVWASSFHFRFYQPLPWVRLQSDCITANQINPASLGYWQ